MHMTALGFIGVGLAIGLAALGSALGQGYASRGAMEGIARQPEASGNIRTTLLLALAFMEALTLFSFVIAILMWTKL
ncbi:ATP synthase F0 subunit C [Moorella sulfitireducens]|jgi:F-type H+-transporting ATPase subunit c